MNNSHNPKTLAYNASNDRYGIIQNGNWIDTGLHCGDTFYIKHNNHWIQDRIELDDEWYLVFSKKRGYELNGLEIRL